MGENDVLDFVDSGAVSDLSPSVPEPPPDPEPAPVDPSPEPLPDPEPVDPLPSDPVGPPSDSDEGLVLPGEDSSVGGEQLSGGDENQQPGEEVPGDDVQQPGQEVPGDLTELPPLAPEDPGYSFGNIPQIVYSLQNTPEELILDNVETFQLSPIEDSTGLKGVLLRVLGPYDNIVTQYRYQQSNNQYYTYVNEVTPDYPWIASAVLFIALLVSLFGLLKRSMTWMK